MLPCILRSGTPRGYKDKEVHEASSDKCTDTSSSRSAPDLTMLGNIMGGGGWRKMGGGRGSDGRGRGQKKNGILGGGTRNKIGEKGGRDREEYIVRG